MANLFYLIVIAVSVSVMSLTVTKAKFFKTVRIWIKTKNEFVYSLFSCPYCFSFYLSFLLLLAFYDKAVLTMCTPLLFFGHNILFVLDFVLAWFCIVAVSSIVSGLIYRAISQMEE